MDNSARIAYTEIRQLLDRRRRELAELDADLDEAKEALVTLTYRRDRVRLAVDSLAVALESLAPDDGPVSVAREAATEEDAGKPVDLAVRLGVIGSIGVACPTCGAQAGEPCQPINGLGYHSERVDAARKAIEDADRG